MAAGWKGIMEEYRSLLPIGPRHARRHVAGGRDAVGARAPPVRTGRSQRLAEGRGSQPDRVLQGPRHDHGHLHGGRGRAQRQSCARRPATPRRRPPPTRHAPGSPAWCSSPKAISHWASWPRHWCTAHASCRCRATSTSSCRSSVSSRTMRRSPSSTRSIPHRIEGQKTGAFEIVDVLGDAPDVHCIPVGNAGNITAYWRGYLQYKEIGRATKLPTHAWFPGCRRRADRAGSPGGEPGDDRHRDPDRQPGQLVLGHGGGQRVRRLHHRGD